MLLLLSQWLLLSLVTIALAVAAVVAAAVDGVDVVGILDVDGAAIDGSVALAAAVSVEVVVVLLRTSLNCCLAEIPPSI